MGVVEQLALEPLSNDLSRVERLLASTVAQSEGMLGESASHLLRAGGKRLRPTLTLCSAYAVCGVEPASERPITGAASVELVHLGSLHHDDVIDEAEVRRSVPSVNARWGNVVSILSGDYLLARASELAASLGADVAELLARTIGELCSGQVLELQSLYDVDRTEESYLCSIQGKTASLMSTSARVGGMVSGASAVALDALTSFGRHLGMCFQVVDDVLDLTRTEAELGKPAGNDLHEGVYTLPVIRALKEVPDLRAILGAPLDWETVARARALVATPEIVQTALETARDHAAEAARALEEAPDLDNAVRDRLVSLVGTLVARSS